MINKKLFLSFLVIVFSTIFKSISANWWLLGMPTAYQSTLELKPTNNYKSLCRHLDLDEKQAKICEANQTNILQTISRGAKMGIEECQFQFAASRWNCSTFENSTKVFGGIIDIHTREKAYIYAISAAGVAYSITKACSMGQLPECGCDERIRNKDTKGRWEWGGCSDDIRFGSVYSKEFVDSGEDINSPGGLMNLHNNEAGRRVIRSNMELNCKCHGVSGSCTIRVCWRKMKPFRAIGDALTRKFDAATQVSYDRKDRSKRMRPTRQDAKKPGRKDLIFYDESPDFCQRNQSIGVLGTKGRQCNATSYGLDGCRLLCCGRGYTTVIKETEEKCNCKFVWCCDVKCDKCMKKTEEHICN